MRALGGTPQLCLQPSGSVGTEAPPSARLAGGTAGCSQSRGSSQAPSQPQKARDAAGGGQDRALWARRCTRAYASLESTGHLQGQGRARPWRARGLRGVEDASR